MSKDRFKVYNNEVLLDARDGEFYAHLWSQHISVDIAESEHAGISLTPEEAVRFGFHLAGLGAKALRAQR